MDKFIFYFLSNIRIHRTWRFNHNIKLRKGIVIDHLIIISSNTSWIQTTNKPPPPSHPQFVPLTPTPTKIKEIYKLKVKKFLEWILGWWNLDVATSIDHGELILKIGLWKKEISNVVNQNKSLSKYSDFLMKIVNWKKVGRSSHNMINIVINFII